MASLAKEAAGGKSAGGKSAGGKSAGGKSRRDLKLLYEGGEDKMRGNNFVVQDEEAGEADIEEAAAAGYRPAVAFCYSRTGTSGNLNNKYKTDEKSAVLIRSALSGTLVSDYASDTGELIAAPLWEAERASNPSEENGGKCVWSAYWLANMTHLTADFLWREHINRDRLPAAEARAVKLYHEAADERKNSQAMFRLFELYAHEYDNGDYFLGLKKDEVKALTYLRAAVEAGGVQAAATLAYKYETGGLGLGVDLAEATRLYKDVATRCPDPYELLDSPPTQTTLYKRVREETLAKHGKSAGGKSRRDLKLLYEGGEDKMRGNNFVVQDEEAGEADIEEAAAAGYRPAVAFCYSRTGTSGNLNNKYKTDEKSAVLIRSALSGTLVSDYASDTGELIAAPLWEAERASNPSEENGGKCVWSAYWLANMTHLTADFLWREHINRDRLPAAEARAVKLYHEAADERKNSQAMFRLFELYAHEYDNGDYFLGLKKDEVKALTYLRAAVEAGDVEGAFTLAHKYETGGLGLVVDLAEATRLYKDVVTRSSDPYEDPYDDDGFLPELFKRVREETLAKQEKSATQDGEGEEEQSSAKKRKRS